MSAEADGPNPIDAGFLQCWVGVAQPGLGLPTPERLADETLALVDQSGTPGNGVQ